MKNMKVKNLLILIFVLVIAVIGLVYVYNNMISKDKGNNSNENEVKTLAKIDRFGYELNENETKEYNDTFDKLAKTLKEDDYDEEEYAKDVVILFINDFLSLDYKVTKTDIGGSQFIYPDALENFVINVQDTIYKNIENNIYGDRKQELPVVKTVTINDVQKSNYIYNDTSYESYVVDASITYEVDLGYMTEATVTLIKDKDTSKLYIAEFK